MIRSKYVPVGVPPRTRVQHVVRIPGAGWHVWLAVDNMQKAYHEWLGTFLLLADDGSVTRVTLRDDGTEHLMEVKPREST